MEGQDNGDELYPIAVLIDELKVRLDEDVYHWTAFIDMHTARRCTPAAERHS